VVYGNAVPGTLQVVLGGGGAAWDPCREQLGARIGRYHSPRTRPKPRLSDDPFACNWKRLAGLPLTAGKWLMVQARYLRGCNWMRDLD